MALGSSGTAVAVELYEPYGSPNYSWGTMPTDHNYTGQRLDSQSGLLYYGARWYDPLADQFTSADSVQGDPSGMDPYGYVGRNPETYVDPTGYMYDPEVPGGGGGGEADSGGGGVSVVSDQPINYEEDSNEVQQQENMLDGLDANPEEEVQQVEHFQQDEEKELQQEEEQRIREEDQKETQQRETQQGEQRPTENNQDQPGDDLSESGIKNTLAKNGARTVNESDLNLSYNENRVYLGHYGGNGTIINGTDVPSTMPGLRMMETLAEDYGGSVLNDLPGTMEALEPAIENSSEILFNIGRDGIIPGSLTAQEFQFVIENPALLQKAIFLFGATY